MKLEFTQRAEVGTGKAAFRFAEGEQVDTETSDKLSTHPSPKQRVKLKDVMLDTEKLIRLGIAKEV